MNTIFDNLNLGDFLLLYRKKNHLTRKKFAKMIGVSSSTLWNWEQNYSIPAVRSLSKLSDVTGESFTTLFHLSKIQ